MKYTHIRTAPEQQPCQAESPESSNYSEYLLSRVPAKAPTHNLRSGRPAEGKLIDVTGQDLTKGITGKSGSITAIEETDTGMKAFVSRDAQGNLYIAALKNKTQAKQFEREVKRTGKLGGLNYEQAETNLGAS